MMISVRSHVKMDHALTRLELLSNELDELESHVRLVFDLSQGCLLSIVDQEKILFANGQWGVFLGWSAKEVVGKRYMDFVHPDDLGPCEAKFAEMGKNPVQGWVGHLRHKDGSFHWFDFAAAVWDADGRAFAINRRLDRAPEQL